MLTAMADTAAETGDQAMQKACLRLFDDITQKQMYVTGAVGASAWHEAFTVDYDLPPDRCYGETCASVAMVFFAHKMLKSRPDGRFADLMELELYNAALAGMQLDGKRFFYVNPLEVDIRVSGKAPGYAHVLPQRPPWHDCACCPPNLARLIASLSGYLWGEDDDTVYSHLLIGSEASTQFGRIRLPNLDINYGIAPLPMMKEEVTSCTSGLTGVFKGKHQQEAYDFVKWYTREESNWESLVLTGIWLPKSEYYYTTEEGINAWLGNEKYPYNKDMETGKKVLVDYTMNYAKPACWYFTPNTQITTNDILFHALQSVWSGERTAEDVINEIYPELCEAILVD